MKGLQKATYLPYEIPAWNFTWFLIPFHPDFFHFPVWLISSLWFCFPPSNGPACLHILKWITLTLESNTVKAHKNPKFLQLRLEDPRAFSNKFSSFYWHLNWVHLFCWGENALNPLNAYFIQPQYEIGYHFLLYQVCQCNSHLWHFVVRQFCFFFLPIAFKTNDLVACFYTFAFITLGRCFNGFLPLSLK